MEQTKRTHVFVLGVWCLVGVLLIVDIDCASVAEESKKNVPSNGTVVTTTVTPCSNSSTDNGTCGNSTKTQIEEPSSGYIWQKIRENKAMLQRAFYVLVGVTLIVIVYFGIKYIRVRKAKSKSRKYGILATADNMEMRPLDQSDEEDDNTLFEMRSNKR